MKAYEYLLIQANMYYDAAERMRHMGKYAAAEIANRMGDRRMFQYNKMSMVQ